MFHRFGRWLVEQVPAQKAALTIHGYFPFFYEMEKRWGKVPSYDQLLIHFTAEGLRRVRLPMRWLSETLQVVVDAQVREDASDLRRIAVIVASLPVETPAAQVLAAYNRELQLRIAAGRVSIRTARLALRPAIPVGHLREERIPIARAGRTGQLSAQCPWPKGFNLWLCFIHK
jgi:hypothetical protein